MIGRDRQLYHKEENKENPQGDPKLWNDKWESLGGDRLSVPVVVTNDDSRIEVFMVDRDRQLYHRWQTKPNGGWNDKWESLGGDWPSNPVIHRDGLGLKIFLVGHDRQLYYGSQDNIDAPVSISSLGGDWLDVQ